MGTIIGAVGPAAQVTYTHSKVSPPMPPRAGAAGGMSLKFLRICHIRKAEELTSFRQRDPRISQAHIIFALVGFVRFLCQRCALGGRFPCGLTFGSHLVCPISVCPHSPISEMAQALDLISHGTRLRGRVTSMAHTPSWWPKTPRPQPSCKGRRPRRVRGSRGASRSVGRRKQRKNKLSPLILGNCE
jgi:hypothetical protein